MAEIFNILNILIKKIKTTVELHRYDDFTIAEYFRKQGAQIGENNRIQIRNFGSEPYLVKIGNHCTIGHRVQFLTHDGAVWLFNERDPSLQSFGIINIRDNCFIGQSSIIMPNIEIGPNSIVGAGSVVTKKVEPGKIFAGNPAREIDSIESYYQKASEIWNKQKPINYFKSVNGVLKISPRDIQRQKYKDMEKLRKRMIEYFFKE